MVDGIGVIVLNLDISCINKVVSKVKIGEKGYLFFLDGERKYIVYFMEKIGIKVIDYFFDKFYVKSFGFFEYIFNGDEKKMVFIINKIMNWKVVGIMYLLEVSEVV